MDHGVSVTVHALPGSFFHWTSDSPHHFGSNGMTIPDLFPCEGLFLLQSFLVRRNSFPTSSLLEVCVVKRRMAGTVQLFCLWDSTCTLLKGTRSFSQNECRAISDFMSSARRGLSCLASTSTVWRDLEEHSHGRRNRCSAFSTI